MIQTCPSEGEYLETNYHPDRELVGGCLLERNLGTPLHSLLQLIVGSYLRTVCKNSYVFVEARLLVDSQKRTYRIPDVMVVERPLKPGRTIVDVPAVVIEIKSPGDTLDSILERCLEYSALGVPNIILLDPDHARQFVFEDNALRLIPEVTIRLPHNGQSFELPAALFAELDELRYPQ